MHYLLKLFFIIVTLTPIDKFVFGMTSIAERLDL